MRGLGEVLVPLFKTDKMPISSHALLPYVVQELENTRPYKVLDLGLGNGIYGALVLNYSKILIGRIPWIVGVEAWGGYEGPLWECYDEIHRNRLQDFITDRKFELIIMMDVIEHLKLKEGRGQLIRYKSMLATGGVLLVSTPAVFCPQGAYEGNPYEEHKCLWKPKHFREMGFTAARDPEGSLFGEKMLIYKFTKQEEKK